MKKLVYLLSFAFALSLTACGGGSSEEKTAQKPKVEEAKKAEKKVDPNRGYIVNIGEQVPQFTADLIDGTILNSEAFKGKVVMLQFTASWCSVCRKEMPFIEEEIWQQYKDREDFVLVGIDRDEPLEKVQQFAKQTKVTYPLALDPGAEIFAKFANKKAGITRNVILNKKGEIVMLTRLFERQEFDEMKAVIAAELAK